MAYVILIVSFSLFFLSDKEPGAEYNEWQKFFHASLILGIFYNLPLSPLSPFSMSPGVRKTVTSFLKHCLGERGTFKELMKGNYVISVGFVDWRVVDH